jgi:hypothetical protein
MTSEWDNFVYAWHVIGWYAHWHESWRVQGYNVSFDERGTIVFNPGAIRYCDLV